MRVGAGLCARPFRLVTWVKEAPCPGPLPPGEGKISKIQEASAMRLGSRRASCLMS